MLGTVISKCWVSVFQTLVLGTLAFYKILETYSMAWEVILGKLTGMKNLVSKTKLQFQWAFEKLFCIQIGLILD